MTRLSISGASYRRDPHTYTHKPQLKGQLVQKIDWKQTDGRTPTIAVPSQLTWSVITAESSLRSKVKACRLMYSLCTCMMWQ